MGAFDSYAELALGAAFRLQGADASYEPPSGPTVSGLRVIVGMADATAEIRMTSFVAPKRVVEVRKSQLPSPAVKGVFAVTRKDGGIDRYVIGAQPKIEDPDGLVWTCLCDPV